ncbi:MAG: 6-carboxytetrahydropterin synthase [Nitrososphaerota archaeon]
MDEKHPHRAQIGYDFVEYPRSPKDTVGLSNMPEAVSRHPPIKIRISDPSLSFDYAHFLPDIEKCSTIHGHTASIEVEVAGEKAGPGLVVDFGILKRVVREVVSELDHRILVCEKYVKSRSDTTVTIRFAGRGGEYSLSAPLSQVFIMSFEPTIENLASYLAESIFKHMPENVQYVKVTASEGAGKFAESIVYRER